MSGAPDDPAPAPVSVLGIDVGGTSVKTVAMTRTYAAAVAASGESDRYVYPDRRTLVLSIQQAVADLNIPAAQVTSIGMCVPGARDPATDIVTAAVNVPGLVGMRPNDLLTGVWKASPPRTSLVSDAHAAAFAWWKHQGCSERLLTLSLGTGVGCCVLDNGSPLHVCGTSSGHIGQMDIGLNRADEPTPLAPDGSRGTVESYLGLPALRARYGQQLDAWLAAPRFDSPPVAALVRVLRIVHAIYRPNEVALLGGVGISMTPLLSQIQAGVNHELTSLARPGWTLAAGSSRFLAAEGAALLAL